MANLKVLHVDLDTGKIVAKNSSSGGSGGPFLELSGGTLTGDLFLNGDPALPLQAATKQYVDNLSIGLDVKESVRAATTSDITLSGLQVIDGVVLAVGDRILIKSQINAQTNGIYVVSTGAWVRSTDADGTPASEVTSGMFTFIEEGVANAGSGWVLSTSNPINLGTTPLTFSKFSSTSTGDFVDTSGDTMTGPLILNADPTVALGSATKQYVDNQVQSIGQTFNQAIASTTWLINHNRSTTMVIVQIIEGSDIIIPDSITIVDANNITVSFSAAIAGRANMVFFN
jgi:hypothetical protein